MHTGEKMETRQANFMKYAVKTTAYALIGTGIAGMFCMQSKKDEALQAALDSSNAKITQLESSYNKIAETAAAAYAARAGSSLKIIEMQNQMTQIGSSLEGKINTARDQLEKKSNDAGSQIKRIH